MLKIACVTAHFPSPMRPTDGRSVYQRLRVLSAMADVRVFFPNAALPFSLKAAGAGSAKLSALRASLDVETEYYNYPSLPLLSRPFNGAMAARVLLPHVRPFAPDLILSYFLYPDAYAALRIGQALSVPVVAGGVGSDLHSIGDRASAMHTRTVLRDVDFVVTVSEDLRRRAVAMGAAEAKTRAIVNGCDTSVFYVRDRGEARQKLSMDSDVEAVVYVGRMDMRKGLRELVQAAVALRARRPRLYVYLVGEGPDKPALAAAIEQDGAGEYIHLLPGCSFDDVALWMAACDLFTLPSYNEGCPNAVLEALACGRPVVATTVGGIPEIMGEACGALVPPRDPVALEQALERVLDSSWDAAAISSSRNRSWGAGAAELMEIFESVIEARRKQDR
jgi:glycosyltransferase involved in cell wall biosynthesis